MKAQAGGGEPCQGGPEDRPEGARPEPSGANAPLSCPLCAEDLQRPRRGAPAGERGGARAPRRGQSAPANDHRPRPVHWFHLRRNLNFDDDLESLLGNFLSFTQLGGIKLRRYQEEAARAVLRSVQEKLGLSLVVMFPRQSGKNELQAQIEAYLLMLYASQPVEIVKISPTWRPQSLNAMRRLERVLNANELTRQRWQRENGYIFRVDQARIYFLSAAPSASIVGATASLLLEVDEAQSVSPEKFDREIAPMAASTNATRVFWGTAWTAQTLLGRELRAGLAAERSTPADDLPRRVFRIAAEEVAREAPAYERFVAEQVARLGRGHPSIRTQYFSEEIDAEAGLFPPERLALMEGAHAWQERPQPGETYAFLVDVGGEEKPPALPGEGEAPEREHDATALVIVAVDRGSLADPLLRAPTYRVTHLRQWHGERHSTLYQQIQALAKTWNPRRVVIDATGLGAGLADFLERALPGRVLRFEFNTLSKSRLGWRFIEVIESGRFSLPRAEGQRGEELVELLRAQARGCAYHVGQRPAQALHWGVPEGARHPATGKPLHDDLLLAAALVARLDNVEWPLEGGAVGIIQGKDPLDQKERF